MDAKSVIFELGSVLGIKGENFILIAANIIETEEAKLQEFIIEESELASVKERPIMGVKGSLSDMVLFSDFVVDVAWKYKLKNNTSISTDSYLKELSEKMHGLPASPLGMNYVMAALDSNGNAIVELFDPLGFFEFCGTVRSYDTIMESFLEPTITPNKAIKLAYKCFSPDNKHIKSAGHRIEAHLIKYDDIKKIVWNYERFNLKLKNEQITKENKDGEQPCSSSAMKNK